MAHTIRTKVPVHRSDCDDRLDRVEGHARRLLKATSGHVVGANLRQQLTRHIVDVQVGIWSRNHRRHQLKRKTCIMRRREQHSKHSQIQLHIVEQKLTEATNLSAGVQREEVDEIVCGHRVRTQRGRAEKGLLKCIDS